MARIISVTQDHIDQGIRWSCDANPLVLAALDAGASAAWVDSSGRRIWVERGRWCYERRLPASVEKWIAVYDLYSDGPKHCRPFDLDLDIDEW